MPVLTHYYWNDVLIPVPTDEASETQWENDSNENMLM